MGWFDTKPRDTAEVIKDPNYHARSWQLQGAAWMAAHLLILRDDPELREIGRRLASASGWFMEEKDDLWANRPALPPAVRETQHEPPRRAPKPTGPPPKPS
jgi:hypothetical protein